MTDCGNAEIRDLLPDLAGEALSPVERSRVQAHVDGCDECAAELAMLRTARAIRPVAAAIDVAAIVARLPRPVSRAAHDDDRSIVSLAAHREAAQRESARQAPARARRALAWSGSRSIWRMAATIGVIIAGGWSVVMVRSGGIGVMSAGRSDSVQLVDAAERARSAVSSTGADSLMVTVASSAGVSVSFGDLGDYTDEELQGVLDRLDKWDGATSTEAVTTAPILPVASGGTR